MDSGWPTSDNFMETLEIQKGWLYRDRFRVQRRNMRNGSVWSSPVSHNSRFQIDSRLIIQEDELHDAGRLSSNPEKFFLTTTCPYNVLALEQSELTWIIWYPNAEQERDSGWKIATSEPDHIMNGPRNGSDSTGLFGPRTNSTILNLSVSLNGDI